MVLSYFKRNWPVCAGALVVLLYFCYFLIPGLYGRFGNDDAYNIYYYWSRGIGALLQGIFLFFSTYYRPMGGVFYYSLYEAFGLNPFPYHVVIILLFLLNTILAYRCASLLSGSRIVGGICSILMIYHPRMPLLAYVPAFIFDVLCFTFFFGALVYYLRIRCHDRELNVRQLLFFLLLYVAALESKELAVSLPVLILAYELLWHAPGRSTRSVLTWLRTAALPALVSGSITVIYIIGKSIGPEALSRNPMYHTTVTFKRFFESNIHLVKDLFYLKPESWLNQFWLLSIWALITYVAVTRHKTHLKFAMIMILVAPLPIAFLPYRGGIMYPILSFAWALVAATVIDSVCRFFSREPVLQRIHPTFARALPLLLAAGWIWHQTDFQHHKVKIALQSAGKEFRSVQEQLTTLLPTVKPGAQIAFYNDIFEGWDAKFIAELLYKDRSITVHLNDKAALSPSDLDKMDYVFAFEQEKLVMLKRPGEAFKPPR